MSNEPIVCPFCPLHCDDVVADVVTGTINVECPVAERQVASLVCKPGARLGDRAIDQSETESVQAALSFSAVPTVQICGATIEEAKELEQLASEGRIQIDFDQASDASAMDQAISRDGVVAATLGDVCRHADLIWIIGDINTRTPRLGERLRKTSASIQETPVLTTEVVSRLFHRTVESSLDRPGDALLNRICQSRYIAVVLGDCPFHENGAVVISELLLRWLAKWNDLAVDVGEGETATQSRAALLRLSNDTSLHSVMRWRNNHVSAVGLTSLTDCEIRVGAAKADNSKPVELQIGGPDPGAAGAHAYLPAATPGIHVPGTTIRGDGSVTLALSGDTATDLAARIDVLRRVL